ncbi:MAG: cytochrome c [Acidimicrobiia bacterium]|nr:cytochrome c [Acidimicrobiia bacterium]
MARRNALSIALCLALASCGGVSGVSSDATGDVEAGEQLYDAKCAECHGEDLRGTDRGPSHLSVVYEPSHHGDAAFLLAARQGVRQHHWDFGDMPPIDGLSDEDLASITAYVRSVQEREGFESYPP